MSAAELQPGQRVLVNWGEKRGWLPGTVEAVSSPDLDEDFCRVQVKMDNGFACLGSGFHPNCVKVAA